eukprot:2214818-Alexandrium_andersonii.AAC.1
MVCRCPRSGTYAFALCSHLAKVRTELSRTREWLPFLRNSLQDAIRAYEDVKARQMEFASAVLVCSDPIRMQELVN